MLVIPFLVFCSVVTLVIALGTTHQRKAVVEQRLAPYRKAITAHQDEVSSPLFVRLVKPLLQMFAGVISGLTPQQAKNNLREKLMRAGNPGNLQANEFRGIKFLVLIVGLLIGLTLKLPLLVNVLLIGVGWLLPDIYLNQKVRARQQAIRLALADVLDLLTVSVEAGLGFDSAVAKVVEKSKGPLAEEFERMLQEIRIGKPRRDALKNLSVRTGVEDLQGFVAAIVQADQLGVSIGKVLRIQSSELRRKRRQKAEEAAMKAPIKMMFPLVALVFPAIFIILLGPAILQFIEAFS